MYQHLLHSCPSHNVQSTAVHSGGQPRQPLVNLFERLWNFNFKCVPGKVIVSHVSAERPHVLMGKYVKLTWGWAVWQKIHGLVFCKILASKLDC